MFLAMVGSCLFSWLTLATTTDVMLLTNSASSALPIIQARVPIVWFYLVMPVIWYGESDNRLVRDASLNALDLRNADATRAFLVNADFRKANLDNAVLKEAGLHGAVLRKASLRGADLLRADLSEAKLLKADLRGANFSEAVLAGAKLRDAKLAGAILSGANLKGVMHLTQAQLDRACGDGYTKLPYGLKIRPCKPHPHPTKLLWTQAPRLLLR